MKIANSYGGLFLMKEVLISLVMGHFPSVSPRLKVLELGIDLTNGILTVFSRGNNALKMALLRRCNFTCQSFLCQVKSLAESTVVLHYFNCNRWK
jgi:hypothetical protein